MSDHAWVKPRSIMGKDSAGSDIAPAQIVRAALQEYIIPIAPIYKNDVAAKITARKIALITAYICLIIK